VPEAPLFHGAAYIGKPFIRLLKAAANWHSGTNT